MSEQLRSPEGNRPGILAQLAKAALGAVVRIFDFRKKS